MTDASEIIDINKLIRHANMLIKEWYKLGILPASEGLFCGKSDDEVRFEIVKYHGIADLIRKYNDR